MFLIFRSAQILLEKKEKNSTIFNRSFWKKKDFIFGIVLFYRNFKYFTSHRNELFLHLAYLLDWTRWWKKKKKKETIFLLTDNINSINVDEHGTESQQTRVSRSRSKDFPARVIRHF